jgi:hypothetical protein
LVELLTGMNLSPPFGVFDRLPDDGVLALGREPVETHKTVKILLFKKVNIPLLPQYNFTTWCLVKTHEM